ncbi:Gag-Pro-Pol polyprotein [Labeo rohita]|uniref:ribonuclease H n=1 Tax=Labeo rohita TaxID=84645 RepID=A0ABQ8L6Q6_LABRO|nr:Gag-Pro-Pol polyprotein [Labeo rohita]
MQCLSVRSSIIHLFVIGSTAQAAVSPISNTAKCCESFPGGHDLRPRSSPVPFFPEVREELMKSWKAPLSARSRYTKSPSLTTLDGGPARGYMEVPELERARRLTRPLVKLRLPYTPWLSCKCSCVELRSATNYALRATKVTAQALGRAMSTMVVQERHLWLNLAEMRDTEKVRFIDAPISQAGLFGETVEEFAQQFSTRVPAQLRQSSNPCLLRAEGGPLREQLRPRNLPVLQLDPSNGPVLVGRWHRQLVLRQLRTLLRLQSVPETGSPGKEDRLTCPDPHSARGRALDSAPTLLPEGRVLSCLDPSIWFAFEGRAFQYKVLPFGLSLLPRVFTKVAEAALAPLREVGIRILYLDDWLILAHSWDLVCAHRDVVLNHLVQLGLQVNWEKSKLSPVQRISFLGVELDSVTRTVSAVVCSNTQMQVYGPPETRSEASGAHGILSCGHAAGFDAHETATTLASYPSPETGMAPRHVSHHTIAISCCGANTDSGLCVPLTFRAKPIMWPILCHAGFALRRVEAPPPVGPADLGSIRPDTSRSLCLIRIHPLPVVVRSNQGSPRYRCTGTQLAEGPAQVCVSPSEPHCTESVQSQGGQGTDSLGGPVLAQQNLVLGPGAPGISPSLAHSSEEGPPLSEEGHNLAPALRSLEPPPMVPGRDQEDFRDLYWKDSQRCGIVSVILPPRRPGQAPIRRTLSPLGITVVLQGLQQIRLSPFQSVELDALSLKTALLTVLTSVKRLGDLQALSINSSCLEFGPADSHVVLRPRPGYVPKLPTTPFRDQVVTLQAISSQENDSNLTLLCPVHALRIYMELTQPFRRSEQLFVCYGEQQKGKLLLRIASAALANWASLTDICRAAGWATPNTFARFYNLG